MTKLALRVTRRWSPLRGRGNRENRPKTFSSEESAHTWAKKEGLKTYTLENLRNSESTTKKIRVVTTE
jgi:hypothetical protein